MAELFGEADITLSAANPQEDEDIVFLKKGTDGGKILNVTVSRTVKTGTAYTAASLSVEIFQIANTDTTDPLSLGKDSVYKKDGIEPAAVASGGEAISDSDYMEPVAVHDKNPTESKEISVRLIRAGGDGTSVETYHVEVKGETI